MGHAERREDPLGDDIDKLLSGDALDDVAQQHESGVVVAELRAGGRVDAALAGDQREHFVRHHVFGRHAGEEAKRLIVA